LSGNVSETALMDSNQDKLLVARAITTRPVEMRFPDVSSRTTDATSFVRWRTNFFSAPVTQIVSASLRNNDPQSQMMIT
jgi:hypothetical protein